MDTKKQILNCLEELIEREAQYTPVLSLNEITQKKKGFSFVFRKKGLVETKTEQKKLDGEKDGKF